MFGELMRWNPDWVPRIETYRKDNDYVVRLDLPGVDPKDVQVQIEGNLLSITGERDPGKRVRLSGNPLRAV